MPASTARDVVRKNVGATPGSSLGYSKSQFSSDLSFLAINTHKNGSKTTLTAPRTRLGYPHEGPPVGTNRAGGAKRVRGKNRVQWM